MADSASGRLYGIQPVAGHPLYHGHGIINGYAACCEIHYIHFDQNRQAAAGLLLDPGSHLADDPGSVFCITAVFILSPIVSRGEELGQGEAMGGVDLNGVKPCRQTAFGGNPIACHDLLDFSGSQFPLFFVN
jgi:hypothetical protein